MIRISYTIVCDMKDCRCGVIVGGLDGLQQAVRYAGHIGWGVTNEGEHICPGCVVELLEKNACLVHPGDPPSWSKPGEDACSTDGAAGPDPNTAPN